MNCVKRTLCIFLSIIILIVSNVSVFAHVDILNVDYDDCIVPMNSSGIKYEDGENESWYELNNHLEGVLTHITYDACYHISHETITIKYYFANYREESPDYTWTTDIYKEYIKIMSHEDAMLQAEITAADIKEAYANSMKKWNDIYYFTYDENGNRLANKIINVVEGTSTDNNLTIYPIDYRYISKDHKDNVTYLASCGPKDLAQDIPTWELGIIHRHYSSWEMNVNVNYYYTHGFISETNSEYNVGAINSTIVDIVRERTGQHELGHILGLFDVDECCSSSNLEDHHEEVLMGYGDDITLRSTRASYKDIAGVAITRGFHTDDDHVWMLRSNTDGTKDVICAQCNGVRYNIALTDGKYEGKTVNPYQSCIHHGGTNEKMLLVATDGERNFFKCQYCRRIETVDLSDNVVLDPYTPIDISRNVYGHDNKYIKITVNHRDTYTFKATPIDGLSVMLYDSNLNSVDLVIDDVFTSEGSDVYLDIGTYYLRIDNSKSSSITAEMTVSPPPHTHEYTQWKFLSDTHHIEQCECGQVGHATGYHVIEGGTGAVLRGKCIYCKSMIFLGNNTFPGIMSMMKYSVNGSYILPNGIIVLVDEDIEAYLNGTLVFYDKDNLPVVQ